MANDPVQTVAHPVRRGIDEWSQESHHDGRDVSFDGLARPVRR